MLAPYIVECDLGISCVECWTDRVHIVLPAGIYS